MVELYTTEPMFKFVTKLHVWKARIKQNRNSSIYLQVYISKTGGAERDFIPINIDWPLDKIDFDKCKLLPTYKGDEDVNDYNMIILNERTKYNEVAKRFRLSGCTLTIVDHHLCIELINQELQVD